MYELPVKKIFSDLSITIFRKNAKGIYSQTLILELLELSINLEISTEQSDQKTKMS